MEKQIIRRKSELPNWYNLAKYQDAEKLDCIGWFWQLSARVELFNFFTWTVPEGFLENYPNSGAAQRTLDHQRESRALWDAIRARPILNSENGYSGKIFLGDILLPPDSGIRPATLADIDQQLFFLRSNERDSALSYLSRADREQHDPMILSPLGDLQQEHLHDTLLNVHLDVPERLLVENFIAFVRKAKGARKSANEEGTRYRMPDFSQWIRMGILPYLDLKIWELELREKLSIPNRVMADAIFEPDEIGGEETVRKTTEKLAYQVLQGSVLKELAVLAATEQLENRER